MNTDGDCTMFAKVISSNTWLSLLPKLIAKGQTPEIGCLTFTNASKAEFLVYVEVVSHSDTKQCTLPRRWRPGFFKNSSGKALEYFTISRDLIFSIHIMFVKTQDRRLMSLYSQDKESSYRLIVAKYIQI